MDELEEIMEEDEPIKKVYIHTKGYKELLEYLTTLIQVQGIVELLEGNTYPCYLSLEAIGDTIEARVLRLLPKNGQTYVDALMCGRYNTLQYMKENNVLFTDDVKDDLRIIAFELVTDLEQVPLPEGIRLYHLAPEHGYLYSDQFIKENNFVEIRKQLGSEYCMETLIGFFFVIDKVNIGPDGQLSQSPPSRIFIGEN